MATAVILPVKSFANAKQRLGDSVRRPGAGGAGGSHGRGRAERAGAGGAGTARGGVRGAASAGARGGCRRVDRDRRTRGRAVRGRAPGPRAGARAGMRARVAGARRLPADRRPRVARAGRASGVARRRRSCPTVTAPARTRWRSPSAGEFEPQFGPGSLCAPRGAGGREGTGPRGDPGALAWSWTSTPARTRRRWRTRSRGIPLAHRARARRSAAWRHDAAHRGRGRSQGLPEIEPGADLAALIVATGAGIGRQRRRGREPEGRLEGGGTARAALGCEALTRGAPARGRARQGAGDGPARARRERRGPACGARSPDHSHASRPGVRERRSGPLERAGRRSRVPAAGRSRRLRQAPAGRAAGAARGRDRRQLRARVAPRPGRRRDRLRRASSRSTTGAAGQTTAVASSRPRSTPSRTRPPRPPPSRATRPAARRWSSSAAWSAT